MAYIIAGSSLLLLLWLGAYYLSQKSHKSMLAYSYCLAIREALHAIDRVKLKSIDEPHSLFIPYKTTDVETEHYRTESLGSKKHEKLIGIYVKSEDMWLMISSEVRQIDDQSLFHEEKYYICEPNYLNPSLLSGPYGHSGKKELIKLSDS